MICCFSVCCIVSFIHNPFQVRLVCSAETPPKSLFTAGHLSLRDEEDNMKLMDDLGIQEVS